VTVVKNFYKHVGPSLQDVKVFFFGYKMFFFKRDSIINISRRTCSLSETLYIPNRVKLNIACFFLRSD